MADRIFAGKERRAIASLMITGMTLRGDRDPRTAARPSAESRARGSNRAVAACQPTSGGRSPAGTGRSARSKATVQLLPVSGTTSAGAGVVDVGQVLERAEDARVELHLCLGDRISRRRQRDASSARCRSGNRDRRRSGWRSCAASVLRRPAGCRPARSRRRRATTPRGARRRSSRCLASRPAPHAARCSQADAGHRAEQQRRRRSTRPARTHDRKIQPTSFNAGICVVSGTSAASAGAACQAIATRSGRRSATTRSLR